MAVGDITKIRNLRWVLLVVGVILLGIGIYMRSNLPELIGKPIKETKTTIGRKTTVTRYWETDDQLKRAKERKEKGDIVFILIVFGGIAVFHGVSGLRKLPPKSTETTKYKDLI